VSSCPKSFNFETDCIDTLGPQLAGLKPECLLILPSEFNQEEVKELLLRRGLALGPFAVMRLEGLAREIILRTQGVQCISLSESLLTEIVKRVVLAKGAEKYFPNLRKKVVLRKQLSAIVRALSQGRKSFANLSEAQIMAERLQESEREQGLKSREEDRPSALFSEFLKLRVAIESWSADATGLERRLDSAQIFAMATELLQGTRVPGNQDVFQKFPKKMVFLRARSSQEPIEEAFLEALRKQVELECLSLFQELKPGEMDLQDSPLRMQGFTAHTEDDAADALAFRLLQEARAGRLHESVVIFNGSAGQRRILNRALKSVGLEQWDGRDPNAFAMSASLQRCLLPLRLIAKGFAKNEVKQWIAEFAPGDSVAQRREWLKEIEASGTLGENGVRGYAAVHPALFAELKKLAEHFPGKSSSIAWAEAHEKWMQTHCVREWDRGDCAWILRGWADLNSDLAALYSPGKRFFASFIVERLMRKLEEMPAPAPRLRPRAETQGVRVYRFGQLPALGWKRAFVFALNAMDLDQRASRETHDEWFRRRIRDRLAVDFPLRAEFGQHPPRSEMMKLLKWTILQSEFIEFFDAQYEAAGKERESMQGLLTELKILDVEWRSLGCHPSRLSSYSTVRVSLPQEVSLAQSISEQSWRLSATAIENYSKCPFLSLFYDRWRVRDVEDADLELPALQQGIFLHEVVRRLVAFLDQNPGKSPDLHAMIEAVWREKRPEALLRGERLERLARRRLIPILENFLDSERIYRQKVPQSRRLILDDQELRFHSMVKNGKGQSIPVEIVGKPDRVDELPEGLFVMDYKSGTNTPTGRNMLDKGYRLQLPFYAIAVASHFKKNVIGAQFIQLHRKGARKDGIFFTAYNGEESGKPTELSGRSHSLMKEEPQEVWNRFLDILHADLENMAKGDFSARPRLAAKTCAQCRVRVSCGINRREADGSDPSFAQSEGADS